MNCLFALQLRQVIENHCPWGRPGKHKYVYLNLENYHETHIFEIVCTNIKFRKQAEVRQTHIYAVETFCAKNCFQTNQTT